MINVLLYLGLTAFAIFSVLARDLLKAAISLAVTSIFLGILFFRMGAPYAGVFEISIAAGLIMVLFISTIMLTTNACEDPSSHAAKTVFPLCMAIFVLADALMVRAFAGRLPALHGEQEIQPFNEILWQVRTLDLVGQIALILAGVAAVLALFRTRRSDDA